MRSQWLATRVGAVILATLVLGGCAGAVSITPTPILTADNSDTATPTPSPRRADPPTAIPSADDPDTATPLSGVVGVFPTQDASTVNGPHMTALAEGVLVYRDGCVWLQDRLRGGEAIVVWPYGYTVALAGSTSVIRDADQREIARMGEPVRLGGGYGGETVTFGEHCTGSVWIAAP